MSIFFALLILVVVVAVIGAIVYVERGQRRISVQYAKRVVGRRMYGGHSTHLPLKVNTAGVIPPIFASSIIMFPATIGGFVDVAWIQNVVQWIAPGTPAYILLYVGFIFFFCYFYTAVTFNPVDVADNMKKSGGYIPGIRPGKRTADYIDSVLTRITPRRGGLCLHRLRFANDSDPAIQRPVLFRRNRAFNRGRRVHRHHGPDRIPHVDQALRRLHEKGSYQDRPLRRYSHESDSVRPSRGGEKAPRPSV